MRVSAYRTESFPTFATQQAGIEITQGAACTIDRKIRMERDKPLKRTGKVTEQRIHGLTAAACEILENSVPPASADKLHRSDKADTATGLTSARSLADLSAPYAVLLYERFLGRPFADHRDSISKLVGNLVENAIEEVLLQAGVSFCKTKRAERLPGFDQTPDFIIPSEFNPQIVIEAKLTEGDGTARDKVKGNPWYPRRWIP